MIEFVNFLAFRKYIITTSFFHTFHPRSRFLVNTDHICQQLKTKTILKGFKTHQSLIVKQKHIKYMNQRTSKNTVTLTSDLLQIKKIIQNGNFIRYAYLFHFLTSMFTIYWFSRHLPHSISAMIGPLLIPSLLPFLCLFWSTCKGRAIIRKWRPLILEYCFHKQITVTNTWYQFGSKSTWLLNIS